jgi:zinc/manganese transport system ATP-binding protein
MVGGEPMTMSPAIGLENLTVAYDHRPAVHHVSGCFESGSLTAVVGPNGAGKSTLLKAIAGLLEPADGHIFCNGADLRRGMAYLPQQAEIDRSFPITVADVTVAGAWQEIGVLGGINAAVRTSLNDVLGAVGLHGFERRLIGSLSAGQFQRVLFARLMLQNASVVLLDEPFAAVDARTTTDLLEILQRWHREKKTVVAALHDFDQVRKYFPQTLLLARELIAWGATAEVLTHDKLQIMRSMSESWDEDAELCAYGDSSA